MEQAKRSYDLRYFELGETFPFHGLPAMPTVCLLVADRIEPPYKFDQLLRDYTSIGCRYFMTWGKVARKLEDVLDETIVQLSLAETNEDLLGIVTSQHTDEPAEEVAHYLLNLALLSEPSIRCCVGFSGDISRAAKDDLRREIQKLAGN